jgi:penicillin-binding protein 1A
MPALQERVRNYSEIKRLKSEMANTADKDSLFNERTVLQIAFVCIDPHSGHVLAMVGGRDYGKYKFNAAIQALRQPGSAFKPYIYTAAIDNGLPPTYMLDDTPYTINNPDGERWTPNNFDNTFGPPIPIREALRRSRNVPAIWLIHEISPALVVKYARQMGITSTLRPYPSLALGTSEVIPIELISSYGIFANNGVLVEPVTITEIKDKTGTVIYSAEPREKEVLSKETVFIMNDMLQNVVNAGTGASIRSIYQIPYDIPIGGKTGTTNDFTDAWFIGFTPHLVAGVWVGFDDPQLKHGLTGSVGALPFWATFMKSVYDSLDLPPASFPEQPVGVVKLKICSITKKLATDYCPTSNNPKYDEEYFIIKYQPTEKCEEHTGQPASGTRRRRAF